MALFGKKRDKTVDLTARYLKHQERIDNLKENMNSAKSPAKTSPAESPGNQRQDFNAGSSFGFLDNASSYNQTSYGQDSGNNSYGSNSYSAYGSQNPQYSGDAEEKRKKLAKRLMDITDKLEELSNQIYHLQQRIEVLEKKNTSGYGY